MVEDLSEKIKKRPHHQIFIFDDVIPVELCEKFIRVIEAKAVDGTTINPNTNVKCKSVCLNAKEEPKLYQQMVNIMTVLSNVMSGFGVNTISDCGYLLRKIHGPTNLHTDSMLDFPMVSHVVADRIRNLTMTIALNGDYDGGEFCFPCQNFKIKLKRGQVVAFPPFWTHPHYTNELRNGTFRYTINTWMHGI
jgi:hypothetical protein|tara:strand:+ start:152 stop:727 length:576 start_codon:yes stop_codon:yes gene_type:complete